MHLGIKVGPDNWREKLINELYVRHVEIYHNFNLQEDYAPLYAWLRANGVQGRLHASTPLPGGVFCTLGTPDAEVRGMSVAMLKRTIDVATKAGLDGVVIHAGSYLVPRLREGRVEVTGPNTVAKEGQRWLRATLDELADYGRERGVEPLIENMPGREFAGYEPVDCSVGVDVRFVSYETLCELGQAGFSLCVDLAHLYAELMVQEGVNGRLHERVREAAVRLAPYARQVHLSTVTPPWNGTDGHSGFLKSDYAQGAIPDRTQLLALLEPFAGRDVWVIPEPLGGPKVHLDNYRRLAEWLEGGPPLNPPRTDHGGEAGPLSLNPPRTARWGEEEGASARVCVSSPFPVGIGPLGRPGAGRGGGLC
jgi:sugar phosphate isomerase/epimerase